MRTRTTLAAALLALAVLTAGCSSADSKPEASASPTQDPGEAFMSAVTNAGLDSYADGVPPAEELGAFPPQWCDGLDSGHSVEWLYDMQQGNLYPIGQTWGTEKTDAYEVLVLGVRTHCPDHSDAVLEELRDNGLY
ncbi:hypothetical protein ACF08A_25695 [Streptomyces cellulosae]